MNLEADEFTWRCRWHRNGHVAVDGDGAASMFYMPRIPAGCLRVASTLHTRLDGSVRYFGYFAPLDDLLKTHAQP